MLGQRGVPIEFTIAGAGVELDRLRSRQEREGIANVRLVGRLPRQRVTYRRLPGEISTMSDQESG